MKTLVHEPVVVRAAEAEVLQSPIGVIQFLTDASATGHRLSTHRTMLNEGAMGASPHHHEIVSESFFVVDGRLQLLVDDAVSVLRAGDFAIVPPGVVHAFAAAPNFKADVVMTITPGIERFEYFRLVVNVLAGQVPPSRLAEVSSTYDVCSDLSAAWDCARA